MKIKTQDLTGPALDWAVAKAEGDKVFRPRVGRPTYWDKADDRWVVRAQVANVGWFADYTYTPSTNWAQGGPIIEREGISIIPFDDTRWEARCAVAVQRTPARFIERRGPTPLIAAMRCYCSAKLGDEIDVPEELCQQQSS